MVMVGAMASPPGSSFSHHRGWRWLEQRVELLHVHALHQVLVGADGVSGAEQLAGVGEGERFDLEEGLHVGRQRGQHRLQVERDQAEGFDAGAAHVLQARVLAFLLGQLPGLVLVDIGVDLVGLQHDFAQGLAVLALGVQIGDLRGDALDRCQQGRAIGRGGAQLAVKALGDEAGSAGSDVDVLAHQIAVDPQHEVFGVEVDVFVFAAELGRQVVAQPLGVHAELQVLQRVQAGAPALAHLLAVVDGEKAVHKHGVGHLAAAELQHGRPEQRVEGDDVLADEVVLLGGRVGHEGVVVRARSCRSSS